MLKERKKGENQTSMFKETKFVQEKLSTLKAVTKMEVEKFMIFAICQTLPMKSHILRHSR